MIAGDSALEPAVGRPWEDIARAYRLLRRVAEALDRIGAGRGWSVRLSPVRCLVLAHLEAATTFGLPPWRLARLLETAPSSLAHHLDALEEAGLIARIRWALHDRRRVSVRLTDSGREALRELRSDLRGSASSSS